MSIPNDIRIPGGVKIIDNSCFCSKTMENNNYNNTGWDIDDDTTNTQILEINTKIQDKSHELYLYWYINTYHWNRY